MKEYNIENVNNPIVYIAISLITVSLFFGFLNNRYIWLAVLTVSLFFITIYVSTNYLFTLIVLIFFALNLFNNYIYYNLKINENYNGDIIVTEKKSYYAVGELKGRLLYLEGDLKGIKTGEKINLSGSFSKKEDFENGIVGSLKIKKVYKVRSTFRRKLYNLREDTFEKLKDNIGERKSALISAAAFGYTDNLDNEDKEEMRNLGIIHAVSVSGLHVALIYAVLKKITGIRLSLVLTGVYVLLTGAAFSSIRALIMIAMLNSALIFRKKYNPLGGIAFSAGVITMFKPYAPYKVGFQLSFLAALGIILFFKSINNKLYRLPKYLNDTISVSIAAQILTLPVMMIQFGQCSLLFLMGNLVLLPLLNILIYLGNLMLVTVYIPAVFDFLSYSASKVINIFDDATEYFNLLFSGSFYVNKSMVILYCFILLSMFIYKKGLSKAKILPFIAGAVMLINIYSPFLRVDYLKEGGFLIAYRGERKIITNARNVNMKELKGKNMAYDGYRKAESVSVGSGIKFKLDGKNYLLSLKDKDYLLRINNKKNEDKNYDIIDFVNKEADGFYIINDKIYCF